MYYVKKLFILSLLVLSISGCSIKGNRYNPDFNSINEIKDLELNPMVVQKNNNSNVNEKIPLRAVSMTSPYGGTFSKYLEVALEEQLKQASLYDSSSDIEISVILLQNDVDIWGFSVGTANLTAQFTVKRNNKIYTKTYSIYHDWSSSFIGQIAITNALNNYPIAIQKLINKFFEDTDLIRFIKN